MMAITIIITYCYYRLTQQGREWKESSRHILGKTEDWAMHTRILENNMEKLGPTVKSLEFIIKIYSVGRGEPMKDFEAGD